MNNKWLIISFLLLLSSITTSLADVNRCYFQLATLAGDPYSKAVQLVIEMKNINGLRIVENVSGGRYTFFSQYLKLTNGFGDDVAGPNLYVGKRYLPMPYSVRTETSGLSLLVMTPVFRQGAPTQYNPTTSPFPDYWTITYFAPPINPYAGSVEFQQQIGSSWMPVPSFSCIPQVSVSPFMPIFSFAFGTYNNATNRTFVPLVFSEMQFFGECTGTVVPPPIPKLTSSNVWYSFNNGTKNETRFGMCNFSPINAGDNYYQSASMCMSRMWKCDNADPGLTSIIDQFNTRILLGAPGTLGLAPLLCLFDPCEPMNQIGIRNRGPPMTIYPFGEVYNHPNAPYTAYTYYLELYPNNTTPKTWNYANLLSGTMSSTTDRGIFHVWVMDDSDLSFIRSLDMLPLPYDSPVLALQYGGLFSSFTSLISLPPRGDISQFMNVTTGNYVFNQRNVTLKTAGVQPPTSQTLIFSPKYYRSTYLATPKIALINSIYYLAVRLYTKTTVSSSFYLLDLNRNAVFQPILVPGQTSFEINSANSYGGVWAEYATNAALDLGANLTIIGGGGLTDDTRFYTPNGPMFLDKTNITNTPFVNGTVLNATHFLLLFNDTIVPPAVDLTRIIYVCNNDTRSVSVAAVNGGGLILAHSPCTYPLQIVSVYDRLVTSFTGYLQSTFLNYTLLRSTNFFFRATNFTLGDTSLVVTFNNSKALLSSTVSTSTLILTCGGVVPLSYAVKSVGFSNVTMSFANCYWVPRVITVIDNGILSSTEYVVASNFTAPENNLVALYYFNEKQGTVINNYAPLSQQWFGNLIRSTPSDALLSEFVPQSVGLHFPVKDNILNSNHRVLSQNGMPVTKLGRIGIEIWETADFYKLRTDYLAAVLANFGGVPATLPRVTLLEILDPNDLNTRGPLTGFYDRYPCAIGYQQSFICSPPYPTMVLQINQDYPRFQKISSPNTNAPYMGICEGLAADSYGISAINPSQYTRTPQSFSNGYVWFKTLCSGANSIPNYFVSNYATGADGNFFISNFFSPVSGYFNPSFSGFAGPLVFSRYYDINMTDTVNVPANVTVYEKLYFGGQVYNNTVVLKSRGAFPVTLNQLFPEVAGFASANDFVMSDSCPDDPFGIPGSLGSNLFTPQIPCRQFDNPTCRGDPITSAHRLSLADTYAVGGTGAGWVGYAGTVYKLGIYSGNRAQTEVADWYKKLPANSPPYVNASFSSTFFEDTNATLLIQYGKVFDFDSAVFGTVQTFSLLIMNAPTRGSLYLNGVLVSSFPVNAGDGSALIYKGVQYSSGAAYATVPFQIYDGISYSTTNTWTFNIIHVDHPPVLLTTFYPLIVRVNRITSLTIDGTDYDPNDQVSIRFFNLSALVHLYGPDGTELTNASKPMSPGLMITAQPRDGTVIGQLETLTFQLVDSSGLPSILNGTINITVSSNFLILTDTATTISGQSVAIAFAGQDTSNIVTAFYTIIETLPGNGTLNNSGILPLTMPPGQEIIYTPNDEFEGIDTFNFYLTDGGTQFTELATFAIIVSNINQLPSFNPEPETQQNIPNSQYTDPYTVSLIDSDSGPKEVDDLARATYCLPVNGFPIPESECVQRVASALAASRFLFFTLSITTGTLPGNRGSVAFFIDPDWGTAYGNSPRVIVTKGQSFRPDVHGKYSPDTQFVIQCDRDIAIAALTNLTSFCQGTFINTDSFPITVIVTDESNVPVSTTFLSNCDPSGSTPGGGGGGGGSGGGGSQGSTETSLTSIASFILLYALVPCVVLCLGVGAYAMKTGIAKKLYDRYIRSIKYDHLRSHDSS